jgi:HD superfamily phosphodiesterase
MNAQTLLPELNTRFQEYVRQFSSDDPVVQQNIDLKAEHTRRVCEAIKNIGASLDLSEDDLCLAEATGLLHDIGRFTQYSRYRTFSDDRSENHALLGVKVIEANRFLEGLEPSAAHIVLRVVGYHNRAALPAGEEERCLFFLKLLRDADKVDIWRVVTQYYQNAGNRRNRSIELDLPDIDRISDEVYEDLMKGRPVRMADLRTLNDFKLLQIGWIYDVNFSRTFRIVQDRKYLETIRDAISGQSSSILEIYGRALAYLEAGASGKKVSGVKTLGV